MTLSLWLSLALSLYPRFAHFAGLLKIPWREGLASRSPSARPDREVSEAGCGRRSSVAATGCPPARLSPLGPASGASAAPCCAGLLRRVSGWRCERKFLFKKKKKKRRSPGGRHGNPLQYSCQENAMDRGAWRAAVHEGRKESDKTEATEH